MTKKKDSMEIMLENRVLIQKIFIQKNKNITKTYDQLKQSLPELQISMSQFKPYVKAMLMTIEAMQKEIDDIKAKKEQAEAEIEKLKSELSKRLKPDRISDPDKRINGWNLVFSGGYFRLFRKVNGNMEAIYLGKKFDREVAETKIREKEKAIGLNV